MINEISIEETIANIVVTQSAPPKITLQISDAGRPIEVIQQAPANVFITGGSAPNIEYKTPGPLGPPGPPGPEGPQGPQGERGEPGANWGFVKVSDAFYTMLAADNFVDCYPENNDILITLYSAALLVGVSVKINYIRGTHIVTVQDEHGVVICDLEDPGESLESTANDSFWRIT